MAYGDIKDQIASRINIIDLISDYIPLKKTGANFKGLCPFHKEKTPSFIVSPEKQIFHCFGCHAGGDIFTFVMQHDSLTFPEALKYLAQKAGVQLPDVPEYSRKREKAASDLKSIYAVVCDYYHRYLLEDKRAEQARRYLALRAFKSDVISSFKLGFASFDANDLLEHLIRQGYQQQDLKHTGLFTETQPGALRPLFRGRLMFPIFNARDEVIGFGGRVLDNNLPKYINTPETKFFRKREELFGLNLAKRAIGQAGYVLVVEGYFDLIRLQEKGFHNSVATLGTALTAEHARTLRRYTNTIYVLFDSDAAGVDAALRGIEVIIEEGLNVYVISLPGSKDPDDFLKDNAPEAFASLVKDKAKDFFDFKLGLLLAKYDRNLVHDLSAITNEMLDLMGKIDNQIELDKYLQKLSRSLNVSEFSLRVELDKKLKRQPRYGENRAAVTSAEPDNKKTYPEEVALIKVLVKHPHLWHAYVSAEIDRSFFWDERVKEIMGHLTALDKDISAADLVALIHADVAETTKALLSEIMLDEDHIENEQRFIEDRLREVKLRNKKRLLALLREKMKQLAAVPASRDGAEAAECLREFTELKKEISDLLTGRVQTAREERFSQ
jgi:DNA primase